jgi:molecular chaperone DnaK (HSP70)
MSLARRQLGDGTTTLPKKLEANIGPYLVVVEGAAVDGAALPGGADVNFLGVTLEDGLSGEYRNIAIDGGIVPVTASAAIARGVWVSVANAQGQIKTAAPGAGTNTYVLGKTMEAASAAGDVIGVLLAPGLMQG